MFGAQWRNTWLAASHTKTSSCHHQAEEIYLKRLGCFLVVVVDCLEYIPQKTGGVAGWKDTYLEDLQALLVHQCARKAMPLVLWSEVCG